VADASGFAPGDHIVLFRAADGGVTRRLYGVTAVNGSVLTLDRVLFAVWAAGDEVREGPSPDVDDLTMLDTFVKKGSGMLGAEHITPVTDNGMEMEFTVLPFGVWTTPDVVFDITRQKESISWKFSGGVWTEWAAGPGVPASSSFPEGDIPNDDSKNIDEDDSPTNGHIYSFDVPGAGSPVAAFDRAVRRHNFLEFVRVRFDGQPFANQDGQQEGARASSKAAWHSRLDVIRDFSGLWRRNDAQPQGEVENEITLGHKPLLQNDPRTP
jgi:hypothetical protein